MIRVLCTDISAMTPADYRTLYEAAAPERKARADRYLRREDSMRCVAADALLRYALGTDRYTLETTENGKPFLRGRADFHFNLSHAGKWVVIAYGDSPVGVDVEELRTDTDLEAIARRFFAAGEQNAVREAEDKRRRFFEIWTAKESWLKYLGTGLKKDLTSFSVLSPEPGLRLHHRTLPDGSILCLCTTEMEYLFELLDVQRLR